MTRLYDIYRGSFGSGPLWLECVEGLELACEKMNEHFREVPAAYFVFSFATREIVASLDTLNTGN